MKRSSRNAKAKKRAEITDYDGHDSSAMIDRAKPRRFEDLGLELPKVAPTQVVSIRLPSSLLNELKAFASARDVPYQSLIKLMLSDSLRRRRKDAA